jgi:hypothetical protein
MMALSNPSFFACACAEVTKSGSCLACESVRAHFVGIKARFARELLPFVQADLAELVPPPIFIASLIFCISTAS